MAQTADILITSAKYNVGEFKKHFQETHGFDYTKPIHAIGLPVAFDTLSDENRREPSGHIKWLKAYPFCLAVGSVGERKNHHELLQAWYKFYQSPEYNNEFLVIAGNFSGFGQRIFSIANSAIFGGSVICIDNIRDQDLVYLYKNCRFTLNLSLCEGWGLPVTESIFYGKPPVVLNSTSLPEACNGLGICLERDTNCIAAEIAKLFKNEGYYLEISSKIMENKSKLLSQQEFTKRFIESLV